MGSPRSRSRSAILPVTSLACRRPDLFRYRLQIAISSLHIRADGRQESVANLSTEPNLYRNCYLSWGTHKSRTRGSLVRGREIAGEDWSGREDLNLRPLVPNSVAGRRPSDTDEVPMIIRANVHAGLLAVPCPSPAPERHDARAPDTGRDHRVTTQIPRAECPFLSWIDRSRSRKSSMVGIELGRVCVRRRVTSLALSVARWGHNSAVATFSEAPL
jgi:hypothetical protein